MMQLLPPALRVATRDTLMAARQTMVGVTPDYLSTIVQRCEFDEAVMGSAIPMDAGGVDAAADDAGSLCQRGVGPGLGNVGGRMAPVAPTARKLPSGGTLRWEKYDKRTNNGSPPGTCGGCGADDRFRNHCPDSPNKGKLPGRKGDPKGGKGGKSKGEGKGMYGRVVEEEAEEQQADNGQRQDEGGSVWSEDDADCVWAVDPSVGESETEDEEGLAGGDEEDGFDTEVGNEVIVREDELGPLYLSPLLCAADPPEGGQSVISEDPWSVGSETWERMASSSFAARHVISSLRSQDASTFTDLQLWIFMNKAICRNMISGAITGRVTKVNCC